MDPIRACHSDPEQFLGQDAAIDSPGEMTDGDDQQNDSDDSMDDEGIASEAGPAPRSPETCATASRMGSMSLNHRSSSYVSHSRNRREPPTNAARTEFPRPRERQYAPVSHYGARGRLQSGRISRTPAARGPAKRMGNHAARIHQSFAKHAPEHRDSGYETGLSRQNTCQQQPFLSVTQPSVSVTHNTQVLHCNGLLKLPSNCRYPNLLLQPDSSPISEEELAGEVKGIYAGLVMVEAKCISMDAAQAADPKSPLGPEQWQALIALHRTLLYEHHDFLMATQHPSAPPTLRGLAIKYSMPARMWKHGIHAFLEVLRHRRPESQDYMLAFIYLAYQMMALLFDTIPAFTDTWIECLGDLARYRMAIEEEKEAHATWGGVAARWYCMASDRHPAVGRLYHHLGILERPSLRKLCLYTKSLTCVIPFPNARDSLATLCSPIVQSEQTIESSSQSLEARVVTFHALIYSDGEADIVDAVGTDALQLLCLQSQRLREIGAYLAVTNIAALLEPKSDSNLLMQLYNAEINLAMQSSRPSFTNTPSVPAPSLDQLIPLVDTFVPSPSLLAATNFCYFAFNMTLRTYENLSDIRDCLPFVHVMLVWLHSLHTLQSRLNRYSDYTFPTLVAPERVSWEGLARFLNSVLQQTPVTEDVLECARKSVLPNPDRKEDARPLVEDYIIRGLSWGQYYFGPGFFDGQTEEEGRTIETPDMHRARAERVLYLGCFLAFHTEFMSYDGQRNAFSATAAGPPPFDPSTLLAEAEAEVSTDASSELAMLSEAVESETASPIPQSPVAPSTTTSGSDEGFTIVTHKEAKVSPRPRPAEMLSDKVRSKKPRAEMQPTIADEDVAVYVESEPL